MAVSINLWSLFKSPAIVRSILGPLIFGKPHSVLFEAFLSQVFLGFGE